MADTELQDLATAITTLDGDELVYVVDDPSGTPASRKMTATNLAKSTRSLIHGYEQLPFWADATTFLTLNNAAAAAGALTTNRLYMIPVRVPYRRAMTKLAAVITTLSASTG